jgi:hypothetical protein
MTTKELLKKADISEATLRLWLKNGEPVAELLDAERDWRGWRKWDERHVRAILQYKESRRRQHEPVEDEHQLALFDETGKEVADGSRIKGRSVA